MPKLSPQEIVFKTPTIPSLPEIFTRLDEAINDPRCSLADISQIISSDTSLAARLLRLANSVFYNFPARINTITRAMTLVGTKQLRDLVLATSVMQAFNRIPAECTDMKSFWQHSIACGVAARTLAIQLRETNIEHFYVAGLLHDIGRLVLYIGAPDEALASLNASTTSEKTLHEAETDLMGFSHAEIGQTLLDHWKLPSALAEPVGFHHQPSAAERYPREATILHFADIIVSGMALGDSGETLVSPLDEASWAHLQIDAEDLPALFQHITVQYEAAIEVFLANGNGAAV